MIARNVAVDSYTAVGVGEFERYILPEEEVISYQRRYELKSGVLMKNSNCLNFNFLSREE